jgi:hypothetical protein
MLTDERKDIMKLGGAFCKACDRPFRPQNRQFFGPDSNREFPLFYSEVLPLEQTCSVVREIVG